MKREDMMRPYDPKKSVWVPTETHDFKEGLLESYDGTKAVVMLGHEVSVTTKKLTFGGGMWPDKLITLLYKPKKSNLSQTS